MTKKGLVTAMVLAGCLGACGGGQQQITISVAAMGEALAVTNETDSTWADAHLLVQSRQEGEGGAGKVCSDESVGAWRPGESRVVPRCGEKTLIRIETAHGAGAFIFVNDRLFRKIGRKEIPLG